jgi:hypothetical protein
MTHAVRFFIKQTGSVALSFRIEGEAIPTQQNNAHLCCFKDLEALKAALVAEGLPQSIVDTGEAETYGVTGQQLRNLGFLIDDEAVL